MHTLNEALSIERERLFVGREHELAYARAWLTEATPPSQTVFISGMGGVGKSTLLLKWIDMAKEHHLLCIWIDARTCTPNVEGLTNALSSQLAAEENLLLAAPISIAEIVEQLSTRKIMLCVDNYDEIQRLDGWLRDTFLPQLPASGILVVLAARQNWTLPWRTDLAWRNRVKHLPLAPLSKAEARQYYHAQGFHNDAEVEKLIHRTSGLPLAMALTSEVSYKSGAGTNDESGSVASFIRSALLREAVAPNLQNAIDILCILPQANHSLLSHLLTNSFTTLDFDQLCHLSFVRPTADGVGLHDVARAYLAEDFRKRDQERFHHLRSVIVDHLENRLGSVEPQKKSAIAATLLAVCRDAFPMNLLNGLTDPLSTTMEPFRSDDLMHLHKLMIDQGRLAMSIPMETNHALLDAIANRFPDDIRVFRSSSGKPIAFMCGLMLYRDTIALLDPLIGEVLKASLPDDIEQMRQLRSEDADTYFTLLGASSRYDKDYSAQELNGIMLMDRYSSVPVYGFRSVLVTSWDVEYFLQLGLSKHSLVGLPPSHPVNSDVVLVQDYRTMDFVDWVRTFLPRPTQPTPVRAPKETKPITVDDIKFTLAVVGEIDELEDSTVAQVLRCSGIELQRRIMDIVYAEAPPFPLTKSGQNMVKFMCQNPSIRPSVAAEQLNIGRATYFRQRRKALNAVIELLQG